jgi:hypothetical protein
MKSNGNFIRFIAVIDPRPSIVNEISDRSRYIPRVDSDIGFTDSVRTRPPPDLTKHGTVQNSQVSVVEQTIDGGYRSQKGLSDVHLLCFKQFASS